MSFTPMGSTEDSILEEESSFRMKTRSGLFFEHYTSVFLAEVYAILRAAIYVIDEQLKLKRVDR